MVSHVRYLVIILGIMIGATKLPSTAFCLMVRLFTLRCTEKQMSLMLNHPDSPYIRCIGFLYLRYATEPSSLYGWFQPYLYDEEPVQISPTHPEITVGEYVRKLLTDMDYYNGTTLLPRLPVSIERELKVKLLQVEQCEERAKGHLQNDRCMAYFKTIGNTIRALYGDEENPITWYDAVIDRVITRDEDAGTSLVRPKFKVTFPEYGNTETVTLGEIDMTKSKGVCDESRHQAFHETSSKTMRDRGYRHDDDRRRCYHDDDDNNISQRHGKDRDPGYNRNSRDQSSHDKNNGFFDKRPHHDNYHSRCRSERSRSRERDGGHQYKIENEDLMEQVRRQEREKSTAKGRMYASRPRTFKDSLGLKQDGRAKKRSTSPEYCHTRDLGNRSSRDNTAKASKAAESLPPPPQKTREELGAIEEKKRKLLAKYG